jgi:hypothetical protein
VVHTSDDEGGDGPHPCRDESGRDRVVAVRAVGREFEFLLRSAGVAGEAWLPLSDVACPSARADARRIFYDVTGSLWENRPGARKRAVEAAPLPATRFRRLVRGSDGPRTARPSVRQERVRKRDKAHGSHEWDRVVRPRVLHDMDDSRVAEGEEWRICRTARAGQGTQPLSTREGGDTPTSGEDRAPPSRSAPDLGWLPPRVGGAVSQGNP